ncbi:MAG: glycosyltransferase family 4 protein [Gemmatimonadota bacterium]|nr:glycosyltransferase family 4 protein [Gemmatimonadota bacterium]
MALRVALVCDWFLPRMGGIELHLRDLALALKDVGIDASVVTTTPGPADVAGVHVHRLAAPLLPGLGVSLSPTIVGQIAHVLRKERIDLVHAHASVVSPVAYAGAIAGAREGRSSVITFHSMLHGSSMLLGASDSLLSWSRQITLTAVSSVVAAQAVRWMPGASIGVLPNAINVKFWRPRLMTERDGGVHFVTAMRLSRKKRPRELVRAFASAVRFVAGAPSMRLTIAGDGRDRDDIARLAAELGIGDRVTLTGHLEREQLRDLYSRADVFVLPSERESFGIAALEARVSGLPVIAMLAGGARDFIASGVNGLLARDEVELARFIARLALDHALRRYIANQNKTAPSEYDWSAVARAHRVIYEAAALTRDAAVAAAQQ